jgi:hypothetical protein
MTTQSQGKFALLNGNNIIVDVATTEFPVHEGFRWVTAPADCINDGQWYFDNDDNTVKQVPAHTPSLEELKELYLGAVQGYIDSIAQLKGYDTGISCASYFNDPHPPFQTDAQAFVPWRSGVWLQCYADFAEIATGTKSLPASTDAYIATINPAKPAGW